MNRKTVALKRFRAAAFHKTTAAAEGDIFENELKKSDFKCRIMRIVRIFGFASKVQIFEPESVKEQYKPMIATVNESLMQSEQQKVDIEANENIKRSCWIWRINRQISCKIALWLIL